MTPSRLQNIRDQVDECGDSEDFRFTADDMRELLAEIDAGQNRERVMKEKVSLMRRVILGTAWLEIDGDEPRKCIKCHRLLDSNDHLEGCLVGQALANETEAT